MADEESNGERVEKLEMHVSSNGEVVRIDLSHSVKWFALPHDHAIMFAMLLLEHAGAKLERKEDPQ